MSVITTVGTIFWIIYGGYGLAVLPLFMIKGKRSLQETKD